jgi:hypothetical protein
MNKINFFIFAAIFGIIIMGICISPVYAHGPKGHEETGFTNYDATKKSMDLIDKLLQKKKLDQGWEINLSRIEILRKSEQGNQTIVVKISRDKGSPEALYIFLDEKGRYLGSNFKGK